MIRLESMTKAARNERLYERLKAEGLFVAVIHAEEGTTEIDSLVVSVEEPTLEAVGMTGAEVMERAETRMRPS